MNRLFRLIAKIAIILIIISTVFLLLLLFFGWRATNYGTDARFSSLEEARQNGKVRECYDSPNYIFTAEDENTNFITDIIINDDVFVVSVIRLKDNSYRTPLTWEKNTSQVVSNAAERLPALSRWQVCKNVFLQESFYFGWCIVNRSGITGEEPYKRFDFEYMGKPYSLFCIARNEGPKG